MSSIMSAQEQLSKTLISALKSSDKSAILELITSENLNTCYRVGDNSMNIIQLAATMKDPEIIKALVKNKKADVNAACNGETALHIAAKNGNAKMVETLIKLKANKTALFNEQTPFEVAKLNENEAVIKALGF